MDAVAADAGVAKMTVYNNFGSKEGLFQAAVRDRTAAVVAGVPGAGELDPYQPEKALLAIDARFLALAPYPPPAAQPQPVVKADQLRS